jgi:hypothetical protein
LVWWLSSRGQRGDVMEHVRSEFKKTTAGDEHEAQMDLNLGHMQVGHSCMWAFSSPPLLVVLP